MFTQKVPKESEGEKPSGSVAGEDPRLGERIQAALDAEIGLQALAAPDIVLAGGDELISRHSKDVSLEQIPIGGSTPLKGRQPE